jgi:uncharacterized protein (DUF2249 family)
MTDTVTLDVRHLEPPIPMEKALAGIARLSADQRLRLLTHREPYPLYELLDGMGFQYGTEPQPNGEFVVLIQRKPRPA